MTAPDADVLVVGAGPAGSAAASALAGLGHRVVVVERATFPRPRIGESLPPKVEGLLQQLGVEAQVAEAGFARMRGTVVVNGAGTPPRFHPFDPEGGRRGYQVERDRFDALLLAGAQARGATLRPGAAAGLGWSGPLRQVTLRDGASLTARFVVDASGGAGWAARALGLRRREAVRTVALAGYWSRTLPPAGFEPTSTLFEILPEGWVWSVLRQDGLRNVTLGLDAGRVKDPAALPLDVYLAAVQASTLVGPLLAGAHLRGGLSAHDATWTRAQRFTSDGLLFAGDAAATIDPLTSQGVYKALRSGLMAAAVVNTALTRPADAALALDHYAQAQDELTHHYGAVARTFYRASPYAALPFWRARMWGDDPAGEAAAEARFEAGQARRADLSAAVRREGGQALRLAAAPGLSLAPRPVIRGGLVVSAPCAVFEGRVVELPDVEPQVLLPLIDDRPMAAVFDAYAAAVGQAPSVVLGRRIMGALLALADPGALTTRVAAPPGPGR